MRRSVKETAKTAVKSAAEVKEAPKTAEVVKKAPKSAEVGKEAPKAAEVKVEAPKETKAAAKPARTRKAPAKTAAKAAAEQPAEKKEPEKAPAKTTEKPARGTAAKKVSETVYLQYLGKEIDKDDLMNQVKEIWTKELKNKVSDMKSVTLYLKPEENKAYYVVNGDVTGSIDL